MLKKKIIKRGLILLGAYIIFAIYLMIVFARVERLNKIYHEKNTKEVTINVSK